MNDLAQYTGLALTILAIIGLYIWAEITSTSNTQCVLFRTVLYLSLIGALIFNLWMHLLVWRVL